MKKSKEIIVLLTMIAILFSNICVISTNALEVDTVTNDISKSIIEGVSDEINVSLDNKQMPTLTLNGKRLELNTDYVVWYYNTASIGTAKMLIIGIGDYTGYIEKEYEITGVYNIDIGESVEICSDTPVKINLTASFDEVELIYDGELLKTLNKSQATSFFEKSYLYAPKDNDSDGIANWTIAEYRIYSYTEPYWNGTRIVYRKVTERTRISSSTIKAYHSPVKNLSWAQTSPIVHKDKIFIQSSIYPAFSYNQELIWSSSDDSIATVDAFGVVTVKNPGNCMITASTSNGLKINQELCIDAMDISKVCHVVCSKVGGNEYKFIINDQYGVLKSGIDYEMSYEIKNNIIYATFKGKGLYGGTLIKYYDANDLKELSYEDLPYIVIENLPTKTNYHQGEQADYSGIVVKMKYSNVINDVINDYTISGFSTDSPGKKTITVCYQDMTDTFDITVEDHNYKLTYETTNHFDKCTVCGDTINVKEHEFDNACDTTCDCGYVRIITHNHRPTFDTSNHFDKCTVCGDVINSKSHEFDNACDTSCNVCGATRTTTHAFGEYVSDNNATTEKDGTKTRTCAVCGHAETITDEGTKLELKNGWESENGKWYFYENGVAVKNTWKKDSTGWCYLDTDGSMATNKWVRDSIGWCYVGSDGYAVTNCWKKDSVGWCYLNSEGSMTINKWVLDGGKWYFLDESGYMVSNTWRQDSKGWCYLGSDGAMATNKWIKDSVGWCYVGKDGYCITNSWMKDSVGWCYLDKDGRMVTNNWVQDSNGLCWLDGSGYWNGIYY